MKTALAALIVGYGLDLLLGDPSFLYHPIRVIGNLIALLEKWLRKVFPKTPKGELAGGVFLVILVCLAGYGVPALLLFAAFKNSSGHRLPSGGSLVLADSGNEMPEG